MYSFRYSKVHAAPAAIPGGMAPPPASSSEGTGEGKEGGTAATAGGNVLESEKAEDGSAGYGDVTMEKHIQGTAPESLKKRWYQAFRTLPSYQVSEEGWGWGLGRCHPTR